MLVYSIGCSRFVDFDGVLVGIDSLAIHYRLLECWKSNFSKLRQRLIMSKEFELVDFGRLEVAVERRGCCDRRLLILLLSGSNLLTTLASSGLLLFLNLDLLLFATIWFLLHDRFKN